MAKKEWHSVKVNVKILISRIGNGDLSPSVVKSNGKECKTKEEAVGLLYECLEQGIDYI